MFAARTNWSLTLNRLSEKMAERRRQGLEILDLTESNPTRCGFALNADEILEALRDPRALTYEPDPRGLLPAREAVAGYYAERGVPINPEQIFLTTSTSEAYSYVFRLLADPGDDILVPQPSYPLFDFLASLNDVHPVPYSLRYDHGWQIDEASVGARLGPRSRAILAVHPNNPTGSFVRRSELDFLLGRCRERGLALVADEVFADYAFSPDKQRAPSHAGVSEILAFTLSGLSKISALPQMKLAWIVASGPPDLLEPALERLEIIADTYLSISAPLAWALPKFLQLRRSVQPQILDRIRSNLRQLDDRLGPDSAITRLETEGGWYAALKLPAVKSDEDWAIEFLTTDGVLVHPGHFYDFPAEGYLILSLLPAPGIFEEGVSRIMARVAESR